MPVEAKPLFRPDVLRPHLLAFQWPPANLADIKAKLAKWAAMFQSRRAEKFNEKELLPDFLTDVFCDVLGYQRPADNAERFTFSREKHVQVDGKFADAVLGNFRPHGSEYIVALEGKGPLDPLDRPHAGRKMSAVDQGYRYAINLPAEWIIVTSMRQTRLYHKGSDQYTFEAFDIERLASDESLLKRFLFLLGAERVCPASGACHFKSLLSSSEKVGKELTRDFYSQYADMRHKAFDQLCQENPDVSRHELLAHETGSLHFTQLILAEVRLIVTFNRSTTRWHFNSFLSSMKSRSRHAQLNRPSADVLFRETLAGNSRSWSRGVFNAASPVRPTGDCVTMASVGKSGRKPSSMTTSATLSQSSGKFDGC